MNYREQFDLWNGSTVLTEEERAELADLAGNEEQMRECFGAELAFGTAGMRGVLGMGTNRMNRFMVKKASAGLAEYIVSEGAAAKNRGCVISYDTRHKSRFFAETAAGVLAARGIKVRLFSECHPVPMLSFAVRELKALCGVMITASHNPKEYNGYKVYGADGAQMGLEETDQVAEAMAQIADPLDIPCAPVTKNPFIQEIGEDIDNAYYKSILKLVLSPKEIKQYRDKVKMVYTPLHGSGFKPVTGVLDKMGIHYTLVDEQTVYDPDFSTVEVPNPELSESLSMGIAKADEVGADVVFGTDPDCDRLGVAVRRRHDQQFEVLTGNQVGILLLDYILTKLSAEKKLPANGAVVKSIVTTEMAAPICRRFGVELVEVPVGFKFIGEKIKQYEKDKSRTYLFGFEESCGYLRGTHARDKDAVTACMLVSEMLCFYESVHISMYPRLQKLYAAYGYYMDGNFSVTYPGLSGMAQMAAIMDRLRGEKVEKIGGIAVAARRDYLTGVRTDREGVETAITLPKANVLYYELADGSRVCMRPSGTEPKLKVYLCIKSQGKGQANRIMEKVQAHCQALLNG